MFAYLILTVNLFLGTLNNILCSSAIVILALVKVLLPTQGSKRFITQMANAVMRFWSGINGLIINGLNPVEWHVNGGENLRKDQWYLLICNHMSWTDILVLCTVFKDKIPMPKFFLKQALLYVPFIGMACWALDMPFMRRHSREYLIRHPEKRGQDLETTRQSCEKFQYIPTTVVNYVEGTRFTTEKHQKSAQQYDHLLAPKSGGIAYTLAAMGEQFDSIIDVTIAYPDNREQPFKDLLFGRLKRVEVHIRTIPMSDEHTGDYFNDKPYKRRFQLWLNNLWQEKDDLLKSIYGRN